ncbi:hypothetical protein [Mycobacterium sp. M26]|uniref:hypothetical protein n=1 Tax=Mycobacterium sp. M26 TaxID=1762962 RepID=UPI0012E39F30|nr:hypothetical protein [Mycobacterium sp. M26]
MLTETDPDRSRLLYQDLSERIALANARDAERARYLTEIAELRAQAESVSDPAPLRALLDHAELIATSGGSADIDLRQAKAAITEQLDAAAAAADRDYVRNAVAESLLELGYETADVDLETPETLVFRQSNSHGVRADVRNGRIDIRAVRLGPIARGDAGSADRDAEDEFCNRIPILLSALRDRGVSADVAERRLPGLSTPETLSLRSDPDRSSSAGERPNKRSRTAR